MKIPLVRKFLFHFRSYDAPIFTLPFMIFLPNISWYTRNTECLTDTFLYLKTFSQTFKSNVRLIRKILKRDRNKKGPLRFWLSKHWISYCDQLCLWFDLWVSYASRKVWFATKKSCVCNGSLGSYSYAVTLRDFADTSMQNFCNFED